MPSSPSDNPERDPLQKLLKDAESELRRRLEDACEAEANGVATESTEQIRQLEDNLLAAALAAKQTIAVRSQMKRRKNAQRDQRAAVARVVGDQADDDADDAHEHRDLDQRHRVPRRFRAVLDGGASARGRARRDLRRGRLRPGAALAVVPAQAVESNGQPEETFTRHQEPSRRGTTR